MVYEQKLAYWKEKNSAHFRKVTEKKKANWALQPQTISAGFSGQEQTAHEARITSRDSEADACHPFPGTQQPELARAT